MNIRRATEKDIPRVLELLSQVLEVHATIRPDVFISGTTKYSKEDLSEMFTDDTRPVYVAVDDEDAVTGYAFCELRNPPFTSTMIATKSIFIDDLCVDEKARGQHIGRALFDHVRVEAVRLGCKEILLNVWEGNDNAYRFYKSMGMSPRETQMEIKVCSI